MGIVSASVRAGLLGWSVAVCLLSAIPAKAAEFAIVGPRATGMGGAGVAVTTDSMATYWNPAGLAMESSLDIQVAQASLQGIDRLGVKDTLDDIDSLDLTDTSLLNQARLQNLLNKLNEPGTSLSAIGSAGLYAKGSIGNFALGFNASDVATGGMFLPDPVSVTVGSSLTINGDFTIQGLEARQVGLSYAYALPSRTLAIGATTKIIQGAAYLGNVGVAGANGDLRFTDDLGKAELSTAMGVDAGVMLRPASWLHLGVVGKDLNEPTFDTPGGQKFKLNPQVRGGVAIVPYPALTLSFDGDITSNRT
ncbi:MAG: conjugal transfer protein TraF, partial [Nitrospiraceae bacterium]